MLEHPGWSGVLAVEEDIVMATNKPVGDNARKGAVRKRSQLKTAPDEGDPRRRTGLRSDERPAWGNRTYEQGIHDYYETEPYWASAV